MVEALVIQRARLKQISFLPSIQYPKAMTIQVRLPETSGSLIQQRPHYPFQPRLVSSPWAKHRTPSGTITFQRQIPISRHTKLQTSSNHCHLSFTRSKSAVKTKKNKYTNWYIPRTRRRWTAFDTRSQIENLTYFTPTPNNPLQANSPNATTLTAHATGQRDSQLEHRSSLPRLQPTYHLHLPKLLPKLERTSDAAEPPN
jgi:hypothetical protein